MFYKLSEAMKAETPVKLVVNGRPEPYFGIIREIFNEVPGQRKAAVIIEHHNYVDTHLLNEITDIID